MAFRLAAEAKATLEAGGFTFAKREDDGVVSNKSFSGTVVFCNTSEYVVGHRSSNWTKEMFQPFYGTILMEM